MRTALFIGMIFLSSCSSRLFLNSSKEKTVEGYEITQHGEKWVVKGFTTDPISFYTETGEQVFVNGEIKIKPIYKQ